MIEKQLIRSREFLTSKTKLRPRLGFILGSGLSGFASQVKADVVIPFGDIPGFVNAGVEGHPGKLVIGTLNSLPVAVMQGRLHAYEGLDYQQVIFPVRALSAFGIKTVVVTNAAGGLLPKMKPGDFMVIKDHLNLTGINPLRGPNPESLGPRFVDMTEPYDRELAKILKDVLKKEKIRFHEGVYVGVMGPTYETAAEIKMYAKFGGGAVGMSTVSEVIAARHLGMKVVGLSCVTNLGTGLSKIKLTHDDVKEMAAKVEAKFIRALVGFTARAKDKV
jgi:purine-nucleoside phosphorylase